MRKFAIIIIILISSKDLFGQAIIIYDNNKIKGAIFPNTYKNTSYKWLDDEYRFTPTYNEIEAFEKKLRSKLKLINKKRWNQKNSCPVIHRNLKKYLRQYLGFIDENGNKYLLINFLWKDDTFLNETEKDEYYNELGDWRKHWQVWFDGCSHYWNVKYYLESDKLFDLYINGSS
jgi:hypothetical protein